MGVAELARETGVTPATVRYYTRVGLLSPTRNPDNDYRCFSGADRRRLRFVRHAQALGLTIGDIKTLLAAADRGEDLCELVQSKVKERLHGIRRQLGDLEQIEMRAAKALASWNTMPSLTPQPGEFCPLIERYSANRPARVDRGRAHAQALG